MRNIMLYEQIKELNTNYLIVKPVSKCSDYTYKAGDLIVTITANKGYNRQIRKGD